FFASFLVDTRKEVGRRAETPARPHAVNKNYDKARQRQQLKHIQPSWIPAFAGMTVTPSRD
ncbi:MAG: hypothetical protein ABI605_07950, partial [Rhizobacter sp.]